MPTSDREPLGPLRAALAWAGAHFIALLIRVFGRSVPESEVPWLVGPTGGEHIGDSPYEECAAREGLALERSARDGGLLERFEELAGPGFDAAAVHPAVRRFYEHTARHRMDIWAETRFPASLALWLLVTTLSRKVDQLNFPLRVLDSAKGMESEIVLLREPGGRVRYAGWYRRLVESGRSVYTGFYMTVHVPGAPRPCVKVVFPMPQGSATVILLPSVAQDGALELDSRGAGFGGPGFYRLQRNGPGRLRVWRIATLVERFRVYVDERGTLRCDHGVRFLGLPVLQLHYRLEELPAGAPASSEGTQPSSSRPRERAS